MPEVLVGEGAEQDYAQALRWYAERSTEAALDFEAEIERAIASIVEGPAHATPCAMAAAARFSSDATPSM